MLVSGVSGAPQRQRSWRARASVDGGDGGGGDGDGVRKGTARFIMSIYLAILSSCSACALFGAALATAQPSRSISVRADDSTVLQTPFGPLDKDDIQTVVVALGFSLAVRENIPRTRFWHLTAFLACAGPHERLRLDAHRALSLNIDF